MVIPGAAAVADGGKLADNIALFARTLRRAGLRLGPASTLRAIEAVRAAGLASREDFYWTLHATLVSRREDRPVFDETFRLFWRSRELSEKMIAMLSPKAPPRPGVEEPPKAGATRAADALREGMRPAEPASDKPLLEIDARFTAAATEVLRRKDFAQMSADELAEARQAIAALSLPRDFVRTRRRHADARGNTIDPRRTLQLALRSGGDLLVPRFTSPRGTRPPLVVIADISGSMSQYSRMMLLFAHALAERRRHVHIFVFGTRLTNVTRQILRRDPDLALEACAEAVSDWSGGTRIGEALARFNRDWARRVLGARARVLLITDGLELGDTAELAHQMERLRKSCGRLVWLNPLLRFEGFAPEARGIRAMLPHVDDFRAVHSLEAISDLCRALSGQGVRSDSSLWRPEEQAALRKSERERKRA